MGRLIAAFSIFFRTLFDFRTAEQVQALLKGLPAPAAEPVAAPSVPKTPPPPARPVVSDALLLLAALQREARLVDFLQEDLSEYADEQVGAAVREIHRDSGKVLKRMFGIRPILTDEEGALVTVPAEFDAARFRLTGKFTGVGPYTGRLRHHGWEATHIDVPVFTGSETAARAVAAAEIEVE